MDSSIPSKDEEQESENTAPNAGAKSAAEILNMLTFLTEMREKKRNVSYALEKHLSVNYGPNQWEFVLKERCATRLRVIRTGNGTNPMVIVDPICPADFSSIDSFIEHVFNCVKVIVDKAFEMHSEPPLMSLDGTLAADPEDLGIPVGEICSVEAAHENAIRVIRPYCQSVRQANPNYANGFLAEGLNLSIIRANALTIAREEMIPLRAAIIGHEANMNLGRVDRKMYPTLLPTDVLHVVANPFRLNTMFDHIPMGVRYSSELVMELICPELSVVPLSPSQILLNAAQSTSKLTCVNSFSGIGERPIMDLAVGFYTMSLICPGSVQFALNFDDIPSSDQYMRLLAGLAAKLLFCYNDDARWNSITNASVRTAESAISRAGLACGVLESRPGPRAVGNPLDLLVGAPRARVDRFDTLRTTPVGAGWRESGATRYAQAPIECPYLNCQNRQLYASDIDDLMRADEEDINASYAQWEIKNAVINLLSAMAKGSVIDTPLRGMPAVFDTCSLRLFKFLIAVNDYNRENI